MWEGAREGALAVDLWPWGLCWPLLGRVVHKLFVPSRSPFLLCAFLTFLGCCFRQWGKAVLLCRTQIVVISHAEPGDTRPQRWAVSHGRAGGGRHHHSRIQFDDIPPAVLNANFKLKRRARVQHTASSASDRLYVHQVAIFCGLVACVLWIMVSCVPVAERIPVPAGAETSQSPSGSSGWVVMVDRAATPSAGPAFASQACIA